MHADMYRRAVSLTDGTTAAAAAAAAAGVAVSSSTQLLATTPTRITDTNNKTHNASTTDNNYIRQRQKSNNHTAVTMTTFVKSCLSSSSSRRLLPPNIHSKNRKSCTSSLVMNYIVIPILFFYLGTRYQTTINERHNDFSYQQQPQQLQVLQSSSSISSSPMVTAPKQLEQLVLAMAHTTKHDFMKAFDTGVPLDNDNQNENDVRNRTDNVLLLYNIQKTIPDRIIQQQQPVRDNNAENNNSSSSSSTSVLSSDDGTTIPSVSIQEAIEHCDVMNVILTSPSHNTRGIQQCVAIVPQYESSHIIKFMRMKTTKRPLVVPLPQNQLEPLTDDEEEEERKMNMLYSSSTDTTDRAESSEFHLIATTQKANGRMDFRVPNVQEETMLLFWKTILLPYLQNIPLVLSELQSIITNMFMDNSNGMDNYYYMDHTVIVMVCNFGQSELLINFVCAAKRRNLALDHLLVFTTDVETTNIVAQLGLHYYYDERNFGSTPTEAADQYGDTNFVAMMMAKVICVQLVSILGYNVLFQDVDMIWYQHPLQYFDTHQLDMNQYDIIFQDDGGRSVRYAPYSANTGFYYVRSNDRTRHLLTALLMSGDVIISSHSHQQVMIALLKEHVSLYGLTVKVLSRDTEEFPGGFHFHQRSKVYMKNLFAGAVRPYIFHMSWTLNKDNKLLFLRQMGEWYVNEKCIQTKQADTTLDGYSADETFVSDCCSNKPLISCHYRDKPSIKPCKSSPSIDKNRPSWW